jgi:hypothetical protein
MGCCGGVQGWRSPRNIAGVSGPALTPAIIGKFALGFAALAGSLESKEAWPTPRRAGDGARDRREAGKCGSLPLEAVADGRDGARLPSGSALILALCRGSAAPFEASVVGAREGVTLLHPAWPQP